MQTTYFAWAVRIQELIILTRALEQALGWCCITGGPGWWNLVPKRILRLQEELAGDVEGEEPDC
jgi:hypothetical protein